MSEIYKKYFPELDVVKMEQFDLFKKTCLEWNEKINVISRNDTKEFEVNHVLHSLSIAKVFHFEEGSEILDFGTGGGFPGIPLAIFFPEVHFTLMDSIAKKMKVVQAAVDALELKNVDVKVGRVVELKKSFDFITCRAVGRLNKILPWVRQRVKTECNNEKANGFIFLKGGALDQEMLEINLPYERILISSFFDEPFFETKEIVYLSTYLKKHKI